MGTFTLDIPDEDAVKEEVKQELAVPPKQSAAITDTAVQKAREIMDADLSDFSQAHGIAKTFEEFGSDLMKQAETKNTILQKRIGDFQRAGGESGEVAKGLEDLAIQMKELDPSALDFTKTGVLGKVFNPVRRYFDRYKTADGRIADIVKSLDKGRQVLKDDNTTLELERNAMRDLSRQLASRTKMGTQMDELLSAKLESMKAETLSEEDAEKVKFVEEEILFPLRQRLMDFQSLLAVNQQAIVAMDIIRKNNLELIRSVDRAKSVTVTALRTAVTIAGALYNQRIVLQKVEMLNTATSQMITATAQMLKTQGTAVHKQAMQAAVSPEDLKAAFADTFAALDDISSYKQEALPKMKASIQEFKMLAEEGEKRISRIERGEKALTGNTW